MGKILWELGIFLYGSEKWVLILLGCSHSPSYILSTAFDLFETVALRLTDWQATSRKNFACVCQSRSRGLGV